MEGLNWASSQSFPGDEVTHLRKNRGAVCSAHVYRESQVHLLLALFSEDYSPTYSNMLWGDISIFGGFTRTQEKKISTMEKISRFDCIKIKHIPTNFCML